MNTVLLVDDDPILRSLIEAHFKKYGDIFQWVSAADDHEAIKVLSQREISLLVTDLAMPLVENGLNLLDFIKKNHPDIPAVIITAVEDKKLLSRLTQEVEQLFRKPVELPELVTAITTTLEKKFFKGILSGVPVASFLQMLRMEKKTCVLQVMAPGREKGLLYLNEGELHNARIDDLHGEAAALEIMALQKCTLHFQYLPKRKMPRTIKADLMALIIESTRLQDEQKNP